jgi:hypothetical protein
MTYRGAWSTLAGGRVKSGDRELASPARQSSIPRSGSFTEARRVYSEDWKGLGKALLSGLRWRGIGWPRARRARSNAGDLVLWWGRERAGEYGRSLWWLYRRGHGQRRRLGLARRGARGGGASGVLWRAQCTSNTWRFVSALVLSPAEQPNVRILP